MPLQSQIVKIPLGTGVDEKSDIKLDGSSPIQANLNVSRPKLEVISRRNTSSYLPNSLALAPQQLRSFLNSPAVVAEDLWPLPHMQPYVQGQASAGDSFQAARAFNLSGAASLALSVPPPQYAADHFIEPVQGSPSGTVATDSAWTYYTDASTGAQMIAELAASIATTPGASATGILSIRHYPVPANPQEAIQVTATLQFPHSITSALKCGAARVAGSNGVILVYGNNGAPGSTLYKYDPTTLGITMSLTIPTASAPVTWDWRFDPTGSFVFIAQQTTGILLTVYKIALSTLTVSSSQTIATATAATAVAIAESDLTTLTVFWAETTAKTVRCATSTTNTFAAFTIQAGAMAAAAGLVTQLSAAERTLPGYSGVTAFGTLWAQTSSGASNFQQQVTVKGYVASAFVQPIGAWDYTYYGSYMVSKALQDRAGQLIMLAYDSTLQRTYFLANFSTQAATNQSPAAVVFGSFSGKTLYAQAGGQLLGTAYPTNFLPLPGAVYTARRSGATSVTFAPGAQVAGLRIASATSPTTPQKVAVLMKWLFQAEFGLNESSAGGSMFFAGGAIAQFDGFSMPELGFWLAPEFSAISAFGAAGFVSAGQYSIIGVFATTDAYGNAIRSSAGPPVTVTAAALNTIGVTYLNLQHTNRQLGQLAIGQTSTIEIYRTQANGSTYYLDTVITLSGPSSTTTLAANLTQSDLALSGNRILYTAGALNNFSPDGTGVSGPALGRVFCADSLDQDAYRNSLAPLFGVGLAFCAEFFDRLPVGAPPGRITAFMAMDDKCFIAKRRGLWYLSGDGPTAAGTGSFTKAQLITKDLGVLNQKAWAIIPQGIIFASEKGVWLLGRDLSLSYVGKDVEDTFAGSPPQDPTTIPAAEARAMLVEDQNQVRFVFRTLSQIAGQSSKIAVYDYFQNTWDYHGPMASADVSKTFVVSDMLSVAGKIYQSQLALDGTGETSCVAAERYDFAPEVASNGAVTSALFAQIGWIKYAGNQSFQRFPKLLGLLRFSAVPPTDWLLQVQISYDFNPAIIDTHTFTYAQLTENNSTPQFEIQPLHRCQSVLVTLTEIFTTAGSFQVTIEDLQIEVSIIGKSMRLSAGKKG